MRLDRRDVDLLVTLAEHRVLTTQLLARISDRNARALRRRLRALFEAALAEATGYARRTGPGRLERILSVTPTGVARLKTCGLLDSRISDDRAAAPPATLIPHLLMINEFRAALVEMQRIVPEVTVRFLASTSPLLPAWTDDQPFVHESFQGPGQRRYAFAPDGVFAVTHATGGKTLLSYLEVDRGTESLGGPGGHRGSVWQKLATYQAAYQADHYKRYEQIFECPLRRFRLCFVAHTAARLAALSTLAREMEMDFALLSDRASIAEEGVWAKIWIEGGRLDRPRLSLIGDKLAATAAAPPCRKASGLATNRRPGSRR